MKRQKTCTKCGARKDFDQFGRNGRSSDGRRSECLVCRKDERARAHKARRQVTDIVNQKWRQLVGSMVQLSAADREHWRAHYEEDMKRMEAGE